MTITLSLCWATRHLKEDIRYCLLWISNPRSHYSIGPSQHTATVSELEISYFVIKSVSRQQKSYFDSILQRNLNHFQTFVFSTCVILHLRRLPIDFICQAKSANS